LPQGQQTVSVGFFLTIGCLQTGQYFCHILNCLNHESMCHSSHRGGQVQFCDHRAKFFVFLQRYENGKRASVSGDRSRKPVKVRGVPVGHLSLDVRIGGKFQNSFDRQIRKT